MYAWTVSLDFQSLGHGSPSEWVMHFAQAKLVSGSVPRVGKKKRGTEVETGKGEFLFGGARINLSEQVMRILTFTRGEA